jgi:hypothetical protein
MTELEHMVESKQRGGGGLRRQPRCATTGRPTKGGILQLGLWLWAMPVWAAEFLQCRQCLVRAQARFCPRRAVEQAALEVERGTEGGGGGSRAAATGERLKLGRGSFFRRIANGAPPLLLIDDSVAAVSHHGREAEERRRICLSKDREQHRRMARATRG